MSHRRRWENEWDDFNHNRGRHCCHGGGFPLVGLVFGIVSFAMTLAFKIVEVVFQVLFGLLSGIGNTSGKSGKESGQNDGNSGAQDMQEVKYTINDIKDETAKNKADIRKNKGYASNVKEFKKTDEPKTGTDRRPAENNQTAKEEHSKDIYVILFILTVIPGIVALAMGKPLYAGIIAAAGFGLMLVTGVIIGISKSMSKKAAEAKAEETVEEDKEENSVEKLIKEAFDKLCEIRKDIDKVEDSVIKDRIEAICYTGEKIIGEVRTNPEKLTYVRKFFYYYLDAFGEIVKKYLKLSKFEESSEEVGKLVLETEKSFGDIEAIFKELCEKLLENDMMNLKAELNVIKNSN
ncbi:MAG: 5-bromo-4-chloroindolyl phosphate hydrolysis family protein [Caulobacteraceae bacterium]